jgi:hypothetical protein
MSETETEDVWVEDNAGDSIPYSEYLKMLREDGYDPRQFDHENYICLRREGRSFDRDAPAVYIKKTTLLEPLRIERLRWQAQVNWSAHFDRQRKLVEELKGMPGQECFIPHDPVKFAESMKRYEERGDPFTPEDIERYGHPRRIAMGEMSSGETYSSYDDDFWDYEAPEHAGTDMEAIAAAAHLGEWEQIIKPSRIERSKDPTKLDLGARWQHEARREMALGRKAGLLNDMLARSICLSTLLPEGPSRFRERVWVVLNGRRYAFLVGQHYKSPDMDLWPNTRSLADIVVTGKIELKE